ncbi:hypothetical protein [Aestuariibaculum marinum]|uniref:Lipocalin-like domain-containing protein n=1 Tax=Aestuariibaculum marinum TaxID=2683592 RepID=A0A8J6U4I9_9FLAO|nr:hypothetical protein [Aestuariibaculum marinum]MBD0824097.1 hypothetical protein [Aestuariibaculum marinum]
MKQQIYILLIACLTLTNCSIASDSNIDSNLPNIVSIEWHLTNVFGGLAGVDNNFELNEIIWIFNEEYGSLTITNTNNDDTIEDGFDSGVYSFSVTEQDSNQFLFVNNAEFGNLIINNSENEMVIDQNITVSGEAADGYIYTFERVIIYEE